MFGSHTKASTKTKASLMLFRAGGNIEKKMSRPELGLKLQDKSRLYITKLASSTS